MSAAAKYRQCDFMYEVLPAISVTKAGWFVGIMLPKDTNHESRPWKVTHGPFDSEKIANEAKVEVHKDFGRPMGIEFRVGKLSTRKKEF